MENLKTFLRKNWGANLLLLVLFVLNTIILRPKFFITGWDNFSSSIDPKVNITRTFFSTWREYRGLGVPGDSESSDFFRQILFTSLSKLLPITLLQQVYLTLCLSVGVIAMFYLAREVLASFDKNKNSQALSLAASIFYLFNLNTLIVFWLPMDMYLSRFALFPLIVLFWLKFIKEKKINLSTIFIFIIASFFLSASYITATIFIILLIFLLVLVIFKERFSPKSVLFLALIFFINLFWLLPFINYSFQKSSIIPQASTYLNPNETQLNEDPEHFVWWRVLSLYPVTFYSRSSDLTGGRNIPIHLLVHDLEQNLVYRTAVLLFPALYLLGSLIILFSKERKKLVWIPILLFSGLLLIRKEYPPLGFIYDWLGRSLPFFKIVFRFGSEKFAPLVLIPACLSTVFALDQGSKWLKKFFNKKALLLLFLVIFGPYLYSFRYCFSEGLVSPLMYNKIPQAYFEIAQTINKDQEFGRVVHLPEAEKSYWKSYSWGYHGSTFLAFLLDKPLLEKTFIPASLENDWFLTSLNGLSKNAQPSTLVGGIEETSNKFLQLCRNSQIKYLVWDETVMTAVPSKNVVFWDKYNTADLKEIIKFLQRRGDLKEVKKYQIGSNEYYQSYKKANLIETNKNLLKEQLIRELALYAFDYQPKAIDSVKTGLFLDPELDQLNPDLLMLGKNIIQTETDGYLIYPFYQTKAKMDLFNDSFSLSFPNTVADQETNLIISAGEPTDDVPVNVSAKLEKANLILEFYQLQSPTVDKSTNKKLLTSISVPLQDVKKITEKDDGQFAADWHILPSQDFSYLRLMLNGLILPLPQLQENQTKEVGTILLYPGLVEVKVLSVDNEQLLDLNSFLVTETPNCYLDGTDGYQHSLDRNADSLKLTSKEGTTCLVNDLNQYLEEKTDHVEVELDFNFTSQDNHPKPDLNHFSRWQSSVYDKIVSLPSTAYFTLCLRNFDTNECLNNHQVISSRASGEIRIPAISSLPTSVNQLFITLPTIGYQENSLTVNKLNLKQFSPIFSDSFELLPQEETDWTIVVNGNLSLGIPKMISKHGYCYNPQTDGFSVYNQPCLGDKSDRLAKEIDDNLILYSHGCENGAIVNLAFNSRAFKLWQVDYHLYSGKYPRFYLKDDFYDYLNQYLSLGQGYPLVEGFKDLQQTAAPFIPSSAIVNRINNNLKNIASKTSFSFLYPNDDLGDNKNKAYTIVQDSEGQGVFSISDFNIIPLPKSWQKTQVVVGQPEKDFGVLEIGNISHLIPSLWSAEIKPKESSKDSYLLVLNQAYDHQWGVFKGSGIKALLGLNKIGAKQIKVNGWANGWIISKEDLDQSEKTRITFFYWPERLAIVGWTISILSLFLAPFILVKTWPRLKDWHFFKKR